MDKKGNKIGSKDDFLRYRSGKMTGAERNAFEKELQKDPFAEDAAEGFLLLSAEEAEKDLNKISKRLTKRTRINPPAIYYRIAASVAVLVIISVIYFSRKSETEVMLGKNESEKPETTLVIAASEPLKDKAEESVVRTEPVIPEKPSQKADYQQRKPIENQQIAVSSELMNAVKDDLKDEVKGEEKADALPAPVAAEDNSSQLAEAEKKMERANVAGVAAPMAAKSLSGPDHSMPQPVTGIDSFNIYLELNVHNPQPGSDKEKSVTISFTVKTDSTLIDLRIIESPGQEYTREAKRLIREGPLWKPAMNDGIAVEEEYRVTIRFR